MIENKKIIDLVNEAEFLLEGLPKGFWRLSKLSLFEIWETPEDTELEYVWVVAIIGNRCIFYDEINKGFVINRYDVHGELGRNSKDGIVCLLNDLIENIVNSRFIIS